MRTLAIGAGTGERRIPAVLARHGLEVDRIEIKPDFSAVTVGFEAPADSLRTLSAAGACAGWVMRRRVQRPPRSGDRQPYRARGRTALVAQSSTRHRSGRHDHDGRPGRAPHA